MVCAPSNSSAHSRDPPPPIRELSTTSASRSKSERGSGNSLTPFALTGICETLGHKLIYVVVVAILDAGANTIGPRDPEAVSDPTLTEGGHAHR